MVVEERDPGFTLAEVLIVIVLIGVVSIVLAATFTIIVRTTPSAQARADDARSMLGITTHFPEDVSSTPQRLTSSPGPHWDLSPNPGTGCTSGIPNEINLLRLRFGDGLLANTAEVTYRLVESSPGGPTTIKRYVCNVGGTAEVVNLTAELPPISSNPVTVSLIENGIPAPDTMIIGAQMVINTVDGDTLRVDAISQNIPTTLPPIPSGSTTTTMAPVNQPPVVNDFTLFASAGDQVTFAMPATDPDGDTVTIVSVMGAPAAWTGQPSTNGLNITFTPDTTDAVLTVTVTDGLLTDSAMLTVSIVPPASTTTTTTSTTTTTLAPCLAGFVSVAPNPVENEPKDNGNNNNLAPLQEEVTVTITKSGDCSNLVLEFVRSTTGAPADRQPQSVPFGAGVVLTLQSIATERWEDGNRVLSLVDTGLVTTLDTETLVIQ